MQCRWQKVVAEGGGSEFKREKRESPSSLFSKKKRGLLFCKRTRTLSFFSGKFMGLMSFSHVFKSVAKKVLFFFLFFR